MASSPTSVQLLSERELRAWRGLLRVHARLVKALDTELENEHGLAVTSYEVLMYVADSPEGRMRMHDLASSVLLSRSGLTRLVDRLEREKLIKRETCDTDARGAFAVLTPAGRDKLTAARRTHLDGVRRHFVEHLSPEELERLGEIWAKVSPGVHG
jgi:DNA-binding MarR family transcriptional regulator